MASNPEFPVRVRPFMPADRDAVLDLAPRLLVNLPPWHDPDVALAATRKWITEEIDDRGDHGAVLVAEGGDGECLGFVTIQRDTHWTCEEHVYVPELVVAEAAEGRGVGRALISGVEAWARERGFRLIALDTGIANTRSRAFYARLGFAEESVKLIKLLESDGR